MIEFLNQKLGGIRFPRQEEIRSELKIVSKVIQREVKIENAPSKVEKTYSFGKNGNDYFTFVLRTNDGSVFVGGGEDKKLMNFNKEL